MPPCTLTLNQLIKVIVFDSYFKSLSFFFIFVSTKKKDMKKFLPFSPQLGENSCV